MRGPFVDANELTRFLLKARKNSWAADAPKVEPQRPGFKELEFSEGDWKYRDSYIGYFCAPGQEIIRFQDIPVWAMSYDGGMNEEFWENLEFTGQTFAFLKRALMMVNEDYPFRGPNLVKQGSWKYACIVEGDIGRFDGYERIDYSGKSAFRQTIQGGLIVPK